MSQPFAVWLTGLPASGKSTIAAELKRALAGAGLNAEVLESDELRRVLTPQPTYSLEERDLFYRALAYFGSRLVVHGVPVLFDATGHRRIYRELARSLIPQFLEVAIVCPLAVCEQRDKKGTYRGGYSGRSATVPGLQVNYEPPLHPDVTIDTTTTKAGPAAEAIMQTLRKRGWLAQARDFQPRA
jgi:adenylylsulfate kinase